MSLYRETGLFLPISDQKTAYRETVKTLPLGSFMIHHITEEEEIVQLSPFANA
jgi:hypothetical protein